MAPLLIHGIPNQRARKEHALISGKKRKICITCLRLSCFTFTFSSSLHHNPRSHTATCRIPVYELRISCPQVCPLVPNPTYFPSLSTVHSSFFVKYTYLFICFFLHFHTNFNLSTYPFCLLSLHRFHPKFLQLVHYHHPWIP